MPVMILMRWFRQYAKRERLTLICKRAVPMLYGQLVNSYPSICAKCPLPTLQLFRAILANPPILPVRAIPKGYCAHVHGGATLMSQACKGATSFLELLAQTQFRF